MIYVPHEVVPRSATSILCPVCLETGKLTVLDSVDCTKEEREKYNCGRPYDCCSKAFAGGCGHRIAMECDPPGEW